MIVWVNGSHGAGKSTTAPLVQALLPGSHILDAEKVGETLMDVRPRLPELDDFQHWPPWRPLVVETARRLLDYVGGTLVIPQTVLVERYWREIADGFAEHGIPVRHFVLHLDPEALRQRILSDEVMGPSDFRLSRVEPYELAFREWLEAEAEVVDAVRLSPDEVARAIADSVERAEPQRIEL